jgi:hypothetical protein
MQLREYAQHGYAYRTMEETLIIFKTAKKDRTWIPYENAICIKIANLEYKLTISIRHDQPNIQNPIPYANTNVPMKLGIL